MQARAQRATAFAAFASIFVLRCPVIPQLLTVRFQRHNVPHNVAVSQFRAQGGASDQGFF